MAWWVWAVTSLLSLEMCLGDSDSLQSALEAINRRQRDLQDPTLYYVDHFNPSARLADSEDGQPEDIGYGYQKSFAPKTAGFFEALPLGESELGSHNPGVETYTDADAKELENIILDYIADNMKNPDGATERRYHYQTQNSDKKRSVFRERDVNIPVDALQNLYAGKDTSRFFENGEHLSKTPSSFRERLPTKPSKHHSDISTQALIRNFGGLNRDIESIPENVEDPDEYLSMLNSVWEKYQDSDHSDPEDLTESDVKEILSYINHKQDKRRGHGEKFETSNDLYNSPLVWVKRDKQRLSDKERPSGDQFLHNIKFVNGPTDKLESLQGDMDDDYRDADIGELLLDEHQLRNKKTIGKRFWRGNTYNEYNVGKQYPVAKRSPSHYPSPAALYRKHSGIERFSQRRKKNVKTHISDDVTDPKIARELNDIFSSADKQAKKSNSTSQKKTQINQVHNSTQEKNNDLSLTKQNKSIASEKYSTEKISSDNAHNSHTHMKRSGQKEETSIDSQHKPFDISKKSVNWSDYFGIDKRRKKSVGNAGNDEWLLDQYLKAYSISARAIKDSGDSKDVKQYLSIDKKSSDDMDNKLRAMEDIIVDQALKYTGAHEGTTDREEAQVVKDNVIAQLAAAYSLEKMRKALSEFKSSMAAQKSPHSTTNAPTDVEEQKDKRVAVKKEKAVVPEDLKKEKKADSDNRIGVIHPSGQSTSQTWSSEESCPIMDDITQRCKDIANMAGDSSEALIPLCNLHQVCYLCGPEMGAAASGCDVTFLAEANSLCGDSPRCRYTVRRTLAAMHTLRGDPSPRGCDWQGHPCLARYLAIALR